MVILKRLLVLLLMLCVIVSTAACGRKNDEVDGSNNDISNIESEIEEQKYDVSSMDFSFTDREKDVTYNTSSAVKIKFSDNIVSITGNGASAEKTKVTLSEESTYVISGKTSDGMIIVDTDENSKIQIVFDNVEITNKTGPAIYIKEADKVFITLKQNSVNSLTDGDSYAYADGETNVDGTVFSKADLAFNGTGTLKITANNKHAIVSKDDLVITGGIYEIKSAGVCLNGKDCIKIADGQFTLNAGSDGLRSDNEEDENRGYIYISGGKFDITSGNDGIQAQTVLNIEDGEFNIKTGGGSANASTNGNGNVNENWGFGGNDFGGRPGGNRPGFRPMSYTQSVTTSESAKGIKSGGDIIISGGTFNIDSADDSVHSNGTADIQNGNFDIKSGDDGIHADTALKIGGGEINVQKSYEGIESSDIVVTGGNIYVIVSDDGMNAAGGNDGSSLNGRPGMNGFSKSSGRIVISGGYILIDASGDGVDSNGSINVAGGTTVVYGPTNSGNGSLDYDGSASITGGVFIALGSSGMAQGFTSAENQGAISAQISTQNGGTLALCDKNGKAIVFVTPKKQYSHIVISCEGVQSGNEYTVVVGGKAQNTDENGFAQSVDIDGGSTILEINMKSNMYGSSGGMGMGGRF